MLKQFIILPYSPHMTTGKIASQVCHASFMALEQVRKNLSDSQGYMVDEDHLITEWKNTGMCVITLGCSTSQQLLGIAEYFKQWKIIHHLYIDEGMTEIEMGTPTALATGIIKPDQQWMLSHLKLFNREPQEELYYKTIFGNKRARRNQ